ncbi:MAG: N-acetylmuramoyl-L-alanine amidase [Verrucomicrobia bacterium]|nr:N-acetylmuramoyl-L-alanine amidase [Verrucomicrobiota bacterium]
MNQFIHRILLVFMMDLALGATAPALSIKVVRPESGEAMALAEGATFVIGTVDSPDATVSCNGVGCDVDADGAFIGFVPIRSASQKAEVGGKICDAQFEFVAHQREQEAKTIVLARTSRGAGIMPAPELFDPPKTVRVTKDLWIGLEGAQLGQIVFILGGSCLTARSLSGDSYRCDVGDGIQVPVASADCELDVPAEPPPYRRCFLLLPKEDTRVDVVNLTRPSSVSIDSWSPNPWGCEFSATRLDCSLKHKLRPSNDKTAAETAVEPGLRGLRVCLDPGHHPDRGAVGPRGFEERESNLLLSREIATLLEAQGAQVSYTREEQPLPIKERHARIRELKPDLVISVHNNSVGDGTDPRLRHGTQTFYLHPWSKPLAEAVHQAILQRMETADLGCIRRNLYIPRFLECPVILIEPEYIILPGQEKKFMSPDYRRKLAGAVVEGIRNFVNARKSP